MLFDKVDEEETIKFVEEQYRIDRESFNKRFGVDVEMLANLPFEVFECNKEDKLGKIKCDNQNRNNRVFKPYNYKINKTNSGM